MLRRRWTVCAMAALLLGGSAAAQSPGTVLVGGYGQWSRYDSNLNLSTSFRDGIGYGGRLGAFIAPGWDIEAEGSYSPAKAAANTRWMNAATEAIGGTVKASRIASDL